MSEANPDVGGGTPIRRIVVGVHGSEPSIRALQWAARQPGGPVPRSRW